MLEVLGLVDLHYVVGALLLVVAIMGVFAGHLRHHLLLQVTRPLTPQSPVSVDAPSVPFVRCLSLPLAFMRPT